MEKVKLTKEQAEQLEKIKKSYNDEPAELVRMQINHKGVEWLTKEETYWDDAPLDDFIKALYIGYEVELTPEEKVLEYFNQTKEKIDQYSSTSIVNNLKGQLHATERILEILDIKIEGVNK